MTEWSPASHVILVGHYYVGARGVAAGRGSDCDGVFTGTCICNSMLAQCNNVSEVSTLVLTQGVKYIIAPS